MASISATKLRTGRLGTLFTLAWIRPHVPTAPGWRASSSQARSGGGAKAYGEPRSLRDLDRQPTISQMKEMSEVRKEFEHCDVPLLPVTFVACPLSQCPRSPRKFALYQWWRIKFLLSNTAGILQFKLKSMPNSSSWPRWKARRRCIAPTAKAMYRSMLQAFAAGDRATIQRLCTPSCAARLISALDYRDPLQYTCFSIVAYNKPLLYPRILSHRIQKAIEIKPGCAIEQAVVAICSTQMTERRLYSTNARVPGSLRTQEKIEYVVLTRFLNLETFQSEDWRIWGTTKATNFQDMIQDLAQLDRLQRERYAEYLKKPAPTSSL
ncbi:hypothetical protein CDD81_5071 [Ophiocordyceps australis]|uniref:Tim44-like domain-containing protein n=1 Tax=Ophiocordyceps australis TaxID=1399860 RepID=A0A2C5XIQ1_9HYPO|nr:hypothetical protein CDD81_5071 [Ophiocordyceps australis]